MPNVTVSLTIPEAEVAEAKEAAQALTGLPATATAKELLAAAFNEELRRWRNETQRPPSKPAGKLT